MWALPFNFTADAVPSLQIIAAPFFHFFLCFLLETWGIMEIVKEIYVGLKWKYFSFPSYFHVLDLLIYKSRSLGAVISGRWEGCQDFSTLLNLFV